MRVIILLPFKRLGESGTTKSRTDALLKKTDTFFQTNN